MLLPSVGRQQRGVRVAWWGIVAILCLGIFLHMVPIYVVLVTSLKSASEVLTFPPTWFPRAYAGGLATRRRSLLRQ